MQPPELILRDHTTIELRVYFPLENVPNNKSQINLELFSFFPSSFGMNATTHKATDFHKHLQALFRLNCPELSLGHLLDLSLKKNPLTLFLDALSRFPEESCYTAEELLRLTRFIGAELLEATRIRARDIQENMSSSGADDVETTLMEVSSFCQECIRTQQVLAKIMVQVSGLRYILPPPLVPTLEFVQEYLLENTLSLLAGIAHTIEAKHYGSKLTQLDVKARMLFAKTINELAQRSPYPRPAQMDTKTKEYFGYRMNRLKKELQQSLYIKPASGKKDRFIAHSAAMVAAGLAATWATLAQIPLLTNQFGSGQGLMFFGAAVGAYVLKDRIKDLVKQRLAKKWSPWDKDHSFQISTLAPFGLGDYTGRVQSELSWKHAKAMTESIAKARQLSQTVEGISSENEHILHYKQVFSTTCKQQSQAVSSCGVQQVLRFSLAPFLTRLDEPERHTYSYDQVEHSFSRVTLPKIYHLNLVARLSVPDTGQVYITRTRAVVDQRGILRIEHIQPTPETVRDKVAPGFSSASTAPSRYSTPRLQPS